MPASPHPLFQKYPLSGKVMLPTGEAPTPYHIYNGYGLFIGGECNLDAARQLLAPEQVTPLATTQGKAIMGIWVCNFSEASLGAHHELQFSLFVTRQPAAPIEPHPFNTLWLMLTRPDVLMVCHGLWNNTPTVVAYNRQQLSLNARLTDSQIDRDPHSVRFSYRDAATQSAIFAGEVEKPQQANLRASLGLSAKIGFRRLMAATKEPWTSMQVINSIGHGLERNAAARTFSTNTTNVFTLFDRRTSSLKFGPTPYAGLHFEPHCVQYMDGFKFVYLDPE